MHFCFLFWDILSVDSSLHLIFETPPGSICGMRQDPTVFFYVYMHALFSSHIFLLSFLNVECRTLHLVTWAEVPTGKHKSTP